MRLGINCLIDLINSGLATSPFEPSRVKIILCGDFNGLMNDYADISRITQLTGIVNKPTRGMNTLDQIFTNYAYIMSPSIHPPIGKSDHSVVSGKLLPILAQPYARSKFENLTSPVLLTEFHILA